MHADFAEPVGKKSRGREFLSARFRMCVQIAAYRHRVVMQSGQDFVNCRLQRLQSLPWRRPGELQP